MGKKAAAAPKKRQPGRPSKFTQAIADRICDRLAQGESLRKIAGTKQMPTMTTVFRWLQKDEKFREQYARARELQADTLADEILDIANTPQIGTKTVSKSTGLEVTEGDMIEHRRLQVDARKWYTGKLAPKKYGDRQQIDMEVKDVTPMADRMKQARERAKGK
jgi:hypothetical protein